MKTPSALLKGRLVFSGMLAFIVFLLTVNVVQGQIFVSDYYGRAVREYNASTGAAINASLISYSEFKFPIATAISGSDLFLATSGASSGNGAISEYTTSGTLINASLISGLSGPFGLAVSGSHLFVANLYSGKIGEYNTTTGAPINASFVSGLGSPIGLAISGNDLFVATQGGIIGEYNATTGAAINASLIVAAPSSAIAISGNDIFVTNTGGDTIGEFTTSGATVNRTLISGLAAPQGIAALGNDLFVVNGSSKISEYTTSGATVNSSFITGLSGPFGITAFEVPEPSTGALLALPLSLLIFARLCRSKPF